MIWGEEDQVFPVELAHRLKRLTYLIHQTIILHTYMINAYLIYVSDILGKTEHN